VPTVVDDATLLTILARAANPELLTLVDQGDVLTTGSWYYRLPGTSRSGLVLAR
jgi:hypothetical protein